MPTDKQKLQRVFNRVAKHLLTQGRKAMDDGLCAYRTHAGDAMCAVGCLINDKHYHEGIESHSVLETSVRRVVLASNPSLRSSKGLDTFIDGMETMLSKLQRIHDDYDPEHWPESLIELANENQLNTRVVERAAKTFNPASAPD